MIVRHISVTNFRGIKTLEWSINAPVVCLVGPGDSTKTTILDAIEYSLYPYFNLQLDDSDFHLSATENEIEIRTTIGQIPEELLADGKFGLFIRGWNKSVGLHDEPDVGDENVLTVRFAVNSSLEPNWMVVNDRSDGKPISHTDRAKLCANRLTSYFERQLSWGRGSMLHRLTDDTASATSALTLAVRNLRCSTDLSGIEEFSRVAEIAKTASAKFGVKPKDGFVPKLDSKTLAAGISAISIHDGQIPLRASGLGTKRLVSLGLQISCSSEGAIVLVDEIEEGLEPFRLRHLLREFRKRAEEPNNNSGQIILTTHSAIATVELPVSCLTIVRSAEGKTECKGVDSELQGTIRAVPEALLASKVLVCEGKTEYGMVIGLDDWCQQQGSESLSFEGVAVVNGMGDNAQRYALHLANLGYRVCLFMDSDKLSSISPSLKELTDCGVKVIHWADSVSTEQRLCLDLPLVALQNLIDLAVEEFGKQSIHNAISVHLSDTIADTNMSIDDWISSGVRIEKLREAIGRAAKKSGWFKRVDYGLKATQAIIPFLSVISTSNLYQVLSELRKWAYL